MNDTDRLAAVVAAGIDLAALLDDVYAFYGQFVSYPDEHAHDAHTLWTAHTHAIDAFDSTPRLAFLSPEWGSGKTRALEITELMVPRPLNTMNISAAAMYRAIDAPAGMPTIEIDECDAIFGPAAKEHEDLRALLNSGHRRGAKVLRCVVRGKEILNVEYSAFAAVAMAGLGHLPDTVLSRSIVIRMKRRAPGEIIEPFRRRLHEAEGYALRDRLAAWGAAATPALRDAWPDLPPTISDRAADKWEPLLAIADMAGSDWPMRARVAAVAYVAADAQGEGQSLGIRLLHDIRTVFGSSNVMSTADLLTALRDLEEAPWSDLKGRPLDARGLSWRLRDYGPKPTNVRINDSIIKGYKREDFHDPWLRYLPSPKEEPATAATSLHGTNGHSPLKEYVAELVEQGALR